MRTIVIGIRGTVLGLDSETGVEVWRTSLKGLNFVNVVLDGNRVLATARGELFCLNRKSGQLLWHNPLKGLGQGLIAIATECSAGQATVLAQQSQQDEAAAAAAASGAVA